MLSEVAVKFGVAVNILHGKIEYIGERALGILVVQLTARIILLRSIPLWNIFVNVPHRWR